MFVSSVSAVQGKGSVPQAIPEDVNLKEMSGKFLFGYGQSKNVAEVLCARALARGIPTVSVRAGFVGGSTTTNVTNYDMMWDFIKTMKVRQVSLESDDHIQITPVDYLAECVTKLVFSERFWTRSAVHLSPPLEKCITGEKHHH
ncbi:hypothetical protein BCR33DRAFT_194598 [Rhizoclosmatium globosum]|uniref:Thioester reductase (TE) domain-containing protein n=1 Tax=Rhizoclosmatium globosum TaxID=329046 RepID=A0A1Y2CDQ7_9FUNG|nr:hypothetical protein BCR33DRAFT_194598 [Rhizoclosmatium globosum]|eukprot:ORY45173.1 hypothetical protein BCR33DRAFT_194598 [Rhizoclosmatium globosum]